ncbi:MAG: hypothetical protein EOS02_27570 [Mesorhizobium sp.]|nr:MAG: hypothetical protein EOS02_27570 [Mesorhizobium sp.]
MALSYSYKKPSYGGWGGSGGGTSSPTVPEVPTVQTTLPTSAYGQTIPVIWGKARLPAAYIWVPPILTVTSSHVEYWDTVTRTTAKMSARLRFARPLVPDSTWTMRKLYANGKLIYDGSVGYRQKGLKFTAYDGRSTQPRDPVMVREEGETNVSAHRGYLDIVVVDFDIVGLGAPPVFEAEWIQDAADTHDYDTFTTMGGNISFDLVVANWDSGVVYGYNTGLNAINWYSIYTRSEFFSVTDTAPYNYTFTFRYSKLLDRLVYLGSGTGTACEATLINPATGVQVAASAGTQSGVPLGGCLVDLNDASLLVGFSSSEQIYAFRLGEATSELSFASSTIWNGYTRIQCVTPGEVRGNEADFWFCADADLVKVTLTALGTHKSTTVVATLADDLRYAVYDDGDLVVWTDVATVKRIDGVTGAVEFTQAVPYQIQLAGTRDLADPDLNRIVNEFYFTAAGVSYFTDLQTGLTRSISGAVAVPIFYLFDGEDSIGVTQNVAGVPQLLRITTGDGSVRQLEDLLTDLMIYGGGYDASEVDVFNVDDTIQGAVFDVTAGVRDVARSIAEPYSIAIFERAGKVIFKRAFTDGSFAVDAVLASAGDIADNP